MPLDNVVPIDADTAQVLHRRAHRFRCYALVLATAWAIALGLVLAHSPRPALVPVVVLAALLILAEHRFELFGDETSMSGSIIVAVASVVIFADSAPLAGPMIVCSMGGLYLPHLRQRAYAKVAANSSGMALAALAAGLAAGRVVVLLPAGPPAATAFWLTPILAYWVVNNCVVAGCLVTGEDRPFATTALMLCTTDTAVIGWVAATTLALGAVGATPTTQLAVTGVAVATYAWAQPQAARLRRTLRIRTPRSRSSGSQRSRRFTRHPPWLVDALALTLIGALVVGAGHDRRPALLSAGLVACLVATPECHRRWRSRTALPGVAATIAAVAVAVPAVAAALLVTALVWVRLTAGSDVARRWHLPRYLGAGAVASLALLGVTGPGSGPAIAVSAWLVAGAVFVAYHLLAMVSARAHPRRLPVTTIVGGAIPSRSELTWILAAGGLGVAAGWGGSFAAGLGCCVLGATALGTARRRDVRSYDPVNFGARFPAKAARPS